MALQLNKALGYALTDLPGEIRELARLGNLFTEQGTWTSLRPVLYTYWS